MKPDFVSFLQCPARDCHGSDLVLHADETATINYKDGPAEEVREGSLECPSCGRRYPISEYVPSFEQLYPEGLQKEGEYWGKFYGFMWKRGYLGFFDLRASLAPLITEGIEVLDPSTLTGRDPGGSHSLIADHPGFAEAEWLLDIGCGTGWSSLYFARRGHKVVGFDPAVVCMRLAKRYAISQGEYIEYMGAGMGFLNFKAGVFDAASALHSIHHVPNLRDEMKIMRDWLKDGAVMGIDEHVRNDDTLMAINSAVRRWAQEEVFPKVRTLSPDVLEGLPRAEPSEMEGAGSEDVIGAFLDNFEVEAFDSRYINLDTFSYLYYLSRLPDMASYEHASGVIDRIYKSLKEAFPNGAEYTILIGRKCKDGTQPPLNELAQRARALSEGQTDLAGRLAEARAIIEEQERAIIAKNRHIEQLEKWAHSLEHDLQAAQGGFASRVRNRFARPKRKT